MTLVQTVAPCGRDPAPLADIATRMLIGVTRDGNLKIPLDQETLTIGRLLTNDICIRSRFISRRHARIINVATGAIIEDLDSHNGILVNGRRIRYWELCSGDRLILGTLHLRYIDLYEPATGDGHA